MPNDNGIKAALQGSVDFSKIKKLLRDSEARILVGLPSGKMHVEVVHSQTKKGKHKTSTVTTDVELSDLAMELHFGSTRTPARPFLTDGIESKKKELKEAIAAEAKKIIMGQGANWDKIGTMAVGAVQELVRSDFYKNRAPNSKKTIEIKGSDTPLIDGANLINSLAYVVEQAKVKGSVQDGGSNAGGK